VLRGVRDAQQVVFRIIGVGGHVLRGIGDAGEAVGYGRAAGAGPGGSTSGESSGEST